MPLVFKKEAFQKPPVARSIGAACKETDVFKVFLKCAELHK
jgi:hypothetical protein